MASKSINVDEIVVIADQTPGKASFRNFEELKDYIDSRLSVYRNTVYTTDNLDQAKNDLEELKAVKKKLTDKKKELEKAYSLPFDVVKKQLDELISMVKEPLDIIDKMIKNTAKEEKKKEIMTYAKEKAEVLGEYANNVLESEAFFNDRWLNTTYKNKDWQADVDNIMINATDAFKTIQNVGGSNKGALMGFYLDKLSLDGAEKFMELAANDIGDSDISDVEDDNNVVGYKVLKIYGTERQMLQFMSQLDLSGMEYDEIEDGMPKEMDELFKPNFNSFVAFDIEHTGTFGVNNGDAESEIIEIGAVKVEDGKIVDKFDMLANPGRKIVPRIARLTHITDEMVANEPPVAEVIKQFKEFVGNSILIGHNIKACDIPHITRAAKKAGINFDNEFLDTRKLANSVKEKKGWEKINLTYLSEYYGIEQSEAHRAWCDAEANAYVFLELVNEVLK